MLAAASILAASVSSAEAEDTWTDPYPGVRHLRRSTADQKIHVAVIDLRRRHIHMRATKFADRGRTVSSFASRYGAGVAVNADFFGAPFGGGTYEPAGLAVGDGERWPCASCVDNNDQTVLAFGADNRSALFFAGDNVAAPEAWMTQLVSGREAVTVNGAANGGVAGNPDVAPRTSAGLSADGKTLYLAVVDGRRTDARGMTLFQLGQLMASVGAHHAINLDGGGSSAMVIRSEGGVQNRPSDGAERTVGNHLGVVIDPLETLAARFVGQGANADPDPDGLAHFRVCAGQKVTFSFELENTGLASWVDVGDSSPGGFGRAVRLGVPTDTLDPFTGVHRVSLADNANPDVHSWNVTGADCNDAALCARTVFTQEGVAPMTPGIHRTAWRLVDEQRAWFGPNMYLDFNVVDCPGGPPDPDGEEDSTDMTGGCSTGGGAAGGALLLLGVLARRRRR